jgi:3-methyladenine DNA glycosylase Mpg
MATNLETDVGAEFFARNSKIVAPDLLGRTIVRLFQNGSEVRGRITETAAYEGGEITSVRRGMLYAPGMIYLMPFRGHTGLNIATEAAEIASCIEIRSAQITVGDKIQEVDSSYKIASALGLKIRGSAEQNLDGRMIGHTLKITGQKPQNLSFSTEQGKAQNCTGVYKIA